MSVVRYKQDRNGISGTLTVRITSETQYGAVGAGGLGPASNPAGILNADGWLRSANGSSDYTMSGVRQGIDPKPPVHRLTVYQGSHPISSVEFYPYETEPGIIDVLVQAAVYNAPDLPTNDTSTLQAYTVQVQGFALKLEQMKAYFEYANPGLTTQLQTTLTNSQTLYNTLNAQLPQTVAITNAAKAQTESMTQSSRQQLQNRGLLNELKGHKDGTGTLPEGFGGLNQPYYTPTDAATPTSRVLVTKAIRYDLVPTPVGNVEIIFPYRRLPVGSNPAESSNGLHQFGVYINTGNIFDNALGMNFTVHFFVDGQPVQTTSSQYFSLAELQTPGTTKGPSDANNGVSFTVRDVRPNWTYFNIRIQSHVPYHYFNLYLGYSNITPNVDVSKRYFEVVHPALILHTYSATDPFTVYPETALELDYQPIATQNANTAADRANQFASAAQTAANNANVAAQSANQTTSQNILATNRATDAANQANTSSSLALQARDSAASAAVSATSAANNANSSAELAFSASNINVTFLSPSTANPRNPTSAELSSFPAPLYGAKAGSPDGWQRVLWSPHTTGGSWTNFGPRLGSSGLTSDQYVSASGTGTVRNSARLGEVPADNFARKDSANLFNHATQFGLTNSDKNINLMTVSRLLVARTADLTEMINQDYQDDFAFLVWTPGRTISASSSGHTFSWSDLSQLFVDDTTHLSVPAGTNLFPLVFNIDCTSSPISPNSNGNFRLGLTFRYGIFPTGIKIENWNGTSYETVQDTLGLTPDHFAGGAWLGNLFSASPSAGHQIHRLRITLTGPVLSGPFTLQRLMLYHATANYDPWRLHRTGGYMFGDVDFLHNYVPKVKGLSIPERTFLTQQSGGTVGRFVRRSGANTWVDANPTDSPDQLACLGVRVGADQVIIDGLVSGFANLIPGERLYLDNLGTFTRSRPTSGTARAVGIAHSTTEIQISGYSDTVDKAPLASPSFTGSVSIANVLNVGGFDLTLGTGDQVTRGNTGTSRALVKENSVLKINYAGDFSGGTEIGGPLLRVLGTDFRLGEGDQSSRGNTGESRALVKIAGSKLAINHAGDFSGGVEIQGSAGVKVIGPVTAPEPTLATHLATKNYVDSKSGSLVPRGSGGSPGYLVTRKGGANVFQNLLPTSPLSDYRSGRVAVMGEFGPISPGQTGRVTGLPFVGGRTYYGGLNGEMVPVPNPRPEDWPPIDLLNSNRVYYEAGVAFQDGSHLFFVHEANALVRYSTRVLGGEKADLQTLPLAPTNAVGNGISNFVVYGGPNTQMMVRGDTDAFFGAGMAPSSVTRSVGGTVMGVSLSERNYGSTSLRFITGQPNRIGGDTLARFQVNAMDWNVRIPGIFFCGVGDLQSGHAYEVVLLGNSGTTGSLHLRRVNFAGGVGTVESPIKSVWPTDFIRIVNEWFTLRVRVDEVTKKVYARVWQSSTPEPTFWHIDGEVVSQLQPGVSGIQSKDGITKWNLLVVSPPGVVASE